MIVVFILGFSSGLPLLLTGGTLAAWMTDANVDISTIGYFSLVGLPYTLKFLWAPLLDRYSIKSVGRRRTWILISQAALIASLCLMGTFDPAENIMMLAVLALAVAFFSATQDIVIDAYRREVLSDIELGLGSSFYVAGYRVAMWIAGGAALIMTAYVSWPTVYLTMGALVGLCALVAIFAPEPKVVSTPKKLSEAVIEPFKDFFKRDGAWLILLFILLYKVGDSMASSMTMPLYKTGVGFTNEQIGVIVKTMGLWAVILGGFIGGITILKIGINKALWIFAFFQAVSTAGFAMLMHTGPSEVALGIVISFENITGGMGTSAFVAYMASLTNKKFTATQYALLTSLMGVPRVIFGAFTGDLVKTMGFEYYFYFCTIIAVPGILLLAKVAPWKAKLPPKEVAT